ncbi:MAG TPA: type II secretion system protein GspG, partial [Terriglobia bacterium]|nr:type II secretion system protein GspG [Terriglobia bacterium]
MKSNKGFTLIELAVVLAIIAVLAAILTPMALNYIDQARVSRAMADAKTIAQAVQLYRKDTGYYPIYASLTAAKAGTTNASVLISAGTGLTSTGSYTSGWATLLAGSNIDLVTQLNTPLSGMNANVQNPGKTSYRGPYIGALDADPWGNTYVVTANNLNSSTNRAFVVSAGPNGTL